MQVYRSDIGKQSNGPCAFDGMRQGSLMLCATTGYPSGNNFPTLGNKIFQCLGIFVINYQTGICTKTANFTPVIDAFFSFWPSVCMMSVGWPDADVMYLMYHSSNIGGVNFAYLNDPQMDQYLETARTDVSPEGHQAAVDAAYKYVVDNAFMVPLVTPTVFYAVRNDFQGVEFSNFVISFANLYYTGE